MEKKAELGEGAADEAERQASQQPWEESEFLSSTVFHPNTNPNPNPNHILTLTLTLNISSPSH